jgi:DNA invertase Pin-like site-specific DNA recombinase
MKAALYLRVSSQEQHSDNQLPSLESYCQGKGWQIAEVYSESESAWRNGHQAELSRLLTDLRSGRRKYDVVLVWALDRLSRLGPLAVLTLIDSFKRCNCRVVSLSEPWTEVDGPLSDILYSLVAWVAKFESDRRSERTLAGLERARREGRRLGRPPGSKDKKKRRRSGYLLRYMDRQQTIG